MFSKVLKIHRQYKNISYHLILDIIKIDQSSLSYFETRKNTTFDLYLNYLRRNGISINGAFLQQEQITSKILQRIRQDSDLKWGDITEFIGITQGALSYIENRKDNKYILYLKVLAQNGVDLDTVFEADIDHH